MLLTTDIGNTNITLGLFDENGNFSEEYRIASDKDMSQSEYEVILKSILKGYIIDGCVIASVVDELSDKIKTALENVLNIKSIAVSYKTNAGITIVADEPEEVGADRIANAAAAAKLYNGAVIVIDFGTATTFDIINSKKEFFGGVIAPGIKTQLKSLNLLTSKLPKIEPDISPCACGHNTQEAILSGVIRGSACMVEGLIKQCENEIGEKAFTIATGGYSGLVANYMNKPFDMVSPILTLEGLKQIYYLNSKTTA